MKRFKTIMSVFAAYITVAGLITFSLFILEESFQTVMFGTWPAQDAKRWDVVKKGIGLMKGIQRRIQIVNWTAGWIQPLAFLSYDSYAVASSFYVEALEAKTLAHAPHLFVGEHVHLNLKPNETTPFQDGSILATFGRIGVRCHPHRDLSNLNVSGTLEEVQGRYVIDIREDRLIPKKTADIP